MGERGQLLWSPTAEIRERCRLGHYLRWLASTRDLDIAPDDYEALWRWSVDDLDGFWGSLWEWFDVRSATPPDAVLTGRDRWPDDLDTLRWFPGATLNYADHALRAEPDGPAVVARSQTRAPVELSMDELRDQVARCRAGLQRLGVRQGDRVAAYLDPGGRLGATSVTWDELLAESGPCDDDAPTGESFEVASYAATPVAFDHPLYVLYSSGTTGLPKPIVHGHGGILLEHYKALSLHGDLGPGDRFFWFSTTGWMMWNYLVSGLLVGATVVLFDGDPGAPDLGELWRLAGDTQVTYFGTSAPFLLACRKQGIEPTKVADLRALRTVGSTGAPLPVEGFQWVYDQLGDDVQLSSVSGGTDVCTAFVGGSPVVPVRAGEISSRYLGARVEAFDPSGASLIGEQGELVISAPMPSMPVGFWGDDDRSRYRAAYFEGQPGVWTHGDWITIHPDGACVITGRSDATLNRGGVRMGTAELYSAVEAHPEITDSLVIHLEDPEGGPGRLILFVTLAEGVVLDDELRRRVAGAIRAELSPRHVPDEMHAVPAVPRTLSGKKLEVPVKRILSGVAPDVAASRGSLTNPDSLDAFAAFASPAVQSGDTDQ